MSSTVKVFGTTYTGVEGIKADDGSGNTLTFTIGDPGVDIPVFTFIWDDNYVTIIDASCNMTFSEVVSFFQNEPYSQSVVAWHYGEHEDPEDGWLDDAFCTEFHWDSGGSATSIDFTAHDTFSTPIYDFTYNNNQSIMYPTYGSSELAKTLNATANGTYTPSGGVYTEVNVNVPSSQPSLQTKSVTPAESAQVITADSGYDGLDEVDVGAVSSSYVGTGIDRRSSTDLTASGATVTAPAGYYASQATKTIASGTEGTPTATKGTVSNHAVSVTPSVTNSAGYIAGGTHTGTAVSVSASELVSGTYTVDSSGTKDVTNYASASVPAGSEGTPTATKGTVSNHSVSVTPSVTNTGGYIAGSTKTGTAVTVSASELVSGTETKTANGTYDVTNLAELVVNVSSGSSATVGTKTATLSAVGQTLTFTGLSGTPKMWAVRCTTQVSSSGSTTYYYIMDAVWNGTSVSGNSFRIGSTRRIYNITSGISQSYSNGTLTITGGSASGSSPGQFYNGGYELVYVY